MERDFSPTYWFRIMRAKQLLGMYKEDPDRFKPIQFPDRDLSQAEWERLVVGHPGVTVTGIILDKIKQYGLWNLVVDPDGA